MKRYRWQSWTVLLLGAWLFASAFLLDHPHGASSANAYVVGLALMLFGTLALVQPGMWEEWANLALGGWLIVSPFALGFAGTDIVTWNTITVGVLVGAGTLVIIFRPVELHAREGLK